MGTSDADGCCRFWCALKCFSLMLSLLSFIGFVLAFARNSLDPYLYVCPFCACYALLVAAMYAAYKDEGPYIHGELSELISTVSLQLMDRHREALSMMVLCHGAFAAFGFAMGLITFCNSCDECSQPYNQWGLGMALIYWLRFSCMRSAIKGEVALIEHVSDEVEVFKMTSNARRFRQLAEALNASHEDGGDMGEPEGGGIAEELYKTFELGLEFLLFVFVATGAYWRSKHQCSGFCPLLTHQVDMALVVTATWVAVDLFFWCVRRYLHRSSAMERVLKCCEYLHKGIKP